MPSSNIHGRARMINSIANRTNVFGIMGGLSNVTEGVKTYMYNRARNFQDLSTDPDIANFEGAFYELSNLKLICSVITPPPDQLSRLLSQTDLRH